MKAIIFSVMSLAASCAGVAAETAPAVTDGEVWNEGVGYYQSGDVTNALRVLRPLMLSKTHGARAAEAVAKLEYDRGNREEAASAAQIALRTHPDDARANRNFTRAVDGLADERETKRVNAILRQAQGKDPGAMLAGATKDARRLMTEAGGVSTNSAERVVALADALSARAERLADAWLPVKEAICQAVTNEEQAQTIVLQVDGAREKTRKAARELSDADANAYSTLSDVEHDFTRFLKLTALPPAAIDEDLVAQSNAWLDVEAFNGRPWQQEALDYTRGFRAKFPAWARAYEQQAQADTNKPPFTAEDQAKISALATELEKIQMECCEKQLPPRQEEAIGIVNQIRELLPKDKSGGRGQSGQPQGQPQGNDRQKQDSDKDDRQDQQNQDGQDQTQDQDPNEQQQDEQEAGEKDASEGDEPEKDEELEALLKKAQERNDEHEADKKARMRKAPLPPNERDW